MNEEELTWTCHVCGRRRPDALIAVHRERRDLPGGGGIGTYVRYCADRQSCKDGAPAKAQRWLERAGEPGGPNV